MSEMTTFERKVDTYKIGLNCPNCAPGELQATGVVKNMLGVRTLGGEPHGGYEHVCNECGHEEFLHETYPKIDYR